MKSNKLPLLMPVNQLVNHEGPRFDYQIDSRDLSRPVFASINKLKSIYSFDTSVIHSRLL